MTLTLEIAPEIEAALTEKARRAGEALPAYAVRVLARDAEAPEARDGLEEIAALYEESLVSSGELTAATTAPGDLHEYSADELAAMEAGEFAQPLRRAA